MAGSDMMAVLALLSMMEGGADLKPSEVFCMAENIYYEARGEEVAGQVAVAHVVKNRVMSSRYPSAYCEVINQPYQFSWTINGADAKTERTSWELAVQTAAFVMIGWIDDNTGGATHYYNPRKARPTWRAEFISIGMIGDHHFMRPRG